MKWKIQDNKLNKLNQFNNKNKIKIFKIILELKIIYKIICKQNTKCDIFVFF